LGTTSTKLAGINDLILAIQKANRYFLEQTQRQVNTALTLRNWVIGYYIVMYEQKGEERAEYGERLLKNLAERIKKTEIRGLGFSILKLCRQFFWAYPQIGQSVTDQIQLLDYDPNEIIQTASKQFVGASPNPTDLLLNRLSFTHFAELVKADGPVKRIFYETETIVNNWSVRELQRAMDSMLFERTGLSKDKEAVLEKHRNGTGMKPEDIFRSPYLLDFLGLQEKPEYVESDLEQAIIDHLQNFLLEMGRGFCFEARQKRITFDNTHYRIDLVFYHRLLRCQ